MTIPVSLPAKPVSRYVSRLYLCQALSVCLSLCAGGRGRAYGRGLSSTASTLALLKCKHRNVTFPLHCVLPLHLSAFSSPTPSATSSFSWTASSFFAPFLVPASPLAQLLQLVLTAGTTDAAAYKLPLAVVPVAAALCPLAQSLPRSPLSLATLSD